MKQYVIKYKDTLGVVHTEYHKALDEECAKSMLIYPAKEIYWVEPNSIY